MRALLSVYDKAGLVELAAGLVDLGFDLVASGQTSAALAEAEVAHRQVAEVTGFPEMLDGRVKTLHPRLHAGILADRAKPEHLEALAAQGIEPVDLVVGNLYPFTSAPSVELIDIGGPALVRAAAKNWTHVGVLVDPADYEGVLSELRGAGHLSEATRRRLATKAFAHTAAYDAAVAAWLAGGTEDLPQVLTLTLERAKELRYGENPHQRGARYRLAETTTWWDEVTQHAGSELSYLNLFDADAAWRLAHELAADTGSVAVAIIKHANPCGAAVGDDLVTAYRRALGCDPVAAFGGVVALPGRLDAKVAAAMVEGPQADVVVASSFTEEAIEALVARRRATRLLSAPPPEHRRTELRTIGASVLVQEPDAVAIDPGAWRVVTKAAPTEEQWRDLVVAWRLCARTTSNAVTVVRDGQGVGVGAGQQSRVEAAELAVSKAGPRAKGAAGASDAFFPFPDGLEVLARAGVAAVVQPGGSVRDAEVVEAADRAKVAMVLTGERHFRH